MRPSLAAGPSFVLAGLLACVPPAVVEPSTPAEPTPATAPTPTPTRAQPRYAVATQALNIHADPNAGAPHLELDGDADPPIPRVVELLEQDRSGGWWRVRTLLPRQALALGFDGGAGLALLSLEGWVDARRIEEVAPGATELAPPSVAVGDADAIAAAPADPLRFVVRAGTALRWLDGRVAGEVAEDHGFYHPGNTREVDGQQLTCHALRSSPELGVLHGWLCVDRGEAPTAGADLSALPVLDTPPRVATDETSSATGGTSRDVIRQVVRDHINEVRGCYNDGLAKDPDLQGRVAIQFVITKDGSVGSAVVSEDSLSDPQVGSCIAKAVRTWKFPAPQGGGNVVVTYPFNLVPG